MLDNMSNAFRGGNIYGTSKMKLRLTHPGKSARSRSARSLPDVQRQW